MNRQSNNAVYVKINTPHQRKSQALEYLAVAECKLIESGSNCQGLKKVLAIDLDRGVVLFTYETGFEVAQECPGQNPGPATKRHAQSSRPQSARPIVFGRGLLRPAGLAAGQIRNVAPGSEGSDADWRRGSQFRVFSPFVLQGPGGLCPRRLSGADSQETRPQGGAQVNRGDHGVRGANPRPRAVRQNPRLGSTDSGRVWNAGAPKDLGASFDCREKKPHQP